MTSSHQILFSLISLPSLLSLHTINIFPLSTSLSPLFRLINFLLQLTQFTQPSPMTDFRPNVVYLSLQTDTETIPIAYYAPVGNRYWPAFNTREALLYELPIYSPSATERTQVSVCVSNSTEDITLILTQDNYNSDADRWSLSQLLVRAENIYYRLK